ncbi:hypothetical protein AX15_005545 [Amanita polypyramis BW_CC]|nr:hypothetical protein AX15_005545 [Amanita polypyramis BW_CC]
MSDTMSVITLNAHRNWTLLESQLALQQHQVYLIQEVPYIDKLRWIPTMDPSLPLGQWIGGAPRSPNFKDFLHNKHRTATYISSQINYSFTYAEEGYDIQIIKASNPDTHEHVLTLVNVYIDHHTTTLAHLRTALTQCTHPIIMCGDFNTPSNHWDESHLRRHPAGDELMAICFENNLTLLNKNGHHTWRQGDRSSLLNLVFVSGQIADNTLLYEGLYLEASDHRPLWITHSINPFQPYRAIIPDSPAEELFIQAIQRTWAEVANLPTNDIPEGFDRSFDHLARLWQGYSTPHAPTWKAKVWWTHQLSETQALVLQGQIPHKQLHKEIKIAKRNYFDSLIEKLAHHKQPWGAVKWTRARPTPSHQVPITDSDSSTPSTARTFEILHNHFVQKDDTNDWHPNRLDPFILPCQQRDWVPISTYKIQTVLKTTQNWSAPGPDKIGWRLIKTILNPTTLQHICKIFNALVLYHDMPPKLKQALMVIIPKPNKSDYKKPKAWCPIVLLPCISKLLMGVLAKRLQTEARAHNLLHPNQYGGILGRSALDAALLFTEHCHQAKLQGLYTSILAVDIAQFFPSIKKNIAIEIYRRQGFAEHLVQFLGSYLSNRLTSYKLGAAASDWFDMDTGIPQGCKICPIVACLYIAPVLKTLVPWDLNSQKLLLSFIDDTGFATSSRSLEVNISYLQSQYPCWKQAFQLLGLRLEDDKTELFHVRAYNTKLQGKPLYKGPLPSINLGSPTQPLIIKPQTSWRYLGFRFDPELNFKSHIDLWTTKASTSLRACQMLGNTQCGLRPKDKWLIYLTTCIPILTYGFQLWYRHNAKGCKNLLKKLDKVHLAAARWITGGFPDSPRNALLGLASLDPIQVTLEKLSYHTALRIHMIHPSAGIALGHKIRTTFLKPSTGKLHIQGTNIIAEPPFTKGRQSTNKGPLTALRNIMLPNLPRANFDDTQLPGTRAINLFPDQITFINIPLCPKEDREEWTSTVAHIITPILQERCLVIVASPPTNVKRQTGVVHTILLQPNTTPAVTTAHLPFSNHHELSLAGLITNLPRALTFEGDFTILLRNQAACHMLFNERNALNAYYRLEFNNIIHPWLTNPRNRLFIGWLPAGIPTPPLLPYVLNLNKLKQHSVPPTYYSPATSWHLAKECAKLDTLDQLRPKTWGKHFPDLGVLSRTPKLRFINAAQNSPGLLSRLTYALTGHGPTGRYYAHRPWFHRQTQCQCDTQTIQSRKHILDYCPLYVHHWESWLRIEKSKDQPLLGLIGFLVDNPLAFSFAHAPDKLPLASC